MPEEIYLHVFLIRPPEVQKPETGQKTGPRTNGKFLWMNWYVYTNWPALEFFQYEHQKYKNRKPDRKPDPDHRENFMCKWTSVPKEIYLHKFFFDTTIQSTKTGNRTENRTPDQPEIFIDEPVWEYKIACIVIFPIGSTMFKRYPIAPTK